MSSRGINCPKNRHAEVVCVTIFEIVIFDGLQFYIIIFTRFHLSYDWQAAGK